MRPSLAAQAPVQGRHVQCGKAVMPQPAQVAIEEGTQVGHAVFQHCDPVDAHAESKALPFGRIDPTCFKHLGVHHAGAEDFEPVVALAYFERAAFP